jgi:hypothetical protein
LPDCVTRAAGRPDFRFHPSETAWLIPFCCPRKYASRGRGLRPRNKKPGAVPRPGGWRTFGEYAFLEDSRYTSQEDFEGNLMWRNFLRF